MADGTAKQEPVVVARSRDFVATMASLASAGFGVMAALAWNEAIKKLVSAIFPQSNSGQIASLFVYAAIVTVFAVLVVSALARLTERLGGERRL